MVAMNAFEAICGVISLRRQEFGDLPFQCDREGADERYSSRCKASHTVLAARLRMKLARKLEELL